MSNKPHPLTNSEFVIYPTGTVLAEGANSSSVYENASGRGVRLFLKVTAVSGTSPTLDVKIQGKDPASGDYFDISGASFAQQTGTGSVLSLIVYPGVAETANESVSDFVARTWKVVSTVGGSNTPTVTCSLGVAYLL